MKSLLFGVLPLVLFHVSGILATKPAPIVFAIQSQPSEFHIKLAEKLKLSILNQWSQYVPSNVMSPPSVVLAHLLDEAASAWTIFPIIKVLAAHMKAEETVEWGAILAENTDIDLRNLNLAVEKYSTFRPSEEPLFLGRVLRDTESSIVHHFARPGALDYPDTESGIFLSRKLVLDVEADLQKLDEGGDKSLKSLFPSDFNIDPAYEFAKFLNKEGKGVELKNVDEICAKKSKKLNCMTSFKQETSCLKSSQAAEMKAVLGRSLVAVKTCSKFHKDRLAAVKATWASRVPHLEYISDAEDDDHPTKVLPFTVNTESGHCNKTMAIVNHFLEQEDKDILVIVDDDTVLSVARLASLLSCYTGEETPVLLGQRYGYMAATGRGYNYITGGGGMVMNRAAASALSSCDCPSADTPDDMHLGMCARRSEIPVLHSGRMFQARPPDYPSSLLAYRKPVSFHKHWEIDPLKVYKDYFAKSDAKLGDTNRDEL